MQTIGAKLELQGEKAYREQMRQITQSTKTMHAETKNMESGWSKVTTAQQKAAQQTQLLNQQIQQQQQNVEIARQNVERFSEAYGENDRRTLQWKEKLALAEAELNNLNRELKEVPSSMQLYGQRMQEIGDKIATAGRSISNVGQTMTRTVTVPLAAIGTASVKMASDFETSMAKVSTIADDTEMSYDDMKQAILDLSNETGVAASDIAESVYSAISAGQDTADAVNFVSQSTKLAKAGFTEAADAVDVMTTILNAYGKEASEAANVSDILITTQNLGKTTVAQLSQTMGTVIPTASAYNVELEQLAAGYVTMTKNGIDTARTTTSLNSMLNELGKTGSKSATILQKETGKSFSDLMAEGYSLTDVLEIVEGGAENAGLSIADMFTNQNARKAALSLTQNVDDFRGALDQMGQSAGATETAFAKVTDTSAARFNRVLNNLKNTGIDLGESILTTIAPTLQTMAEKIKDLTEWFGNLDDKQKEQIVKFGLLAAAIGPVLTVAGKLVTGVGEITKGIGLLTEHLPAAAAGLGPVAAAFGSLAVIAYAGYKDLERGAKDANSELYDTIDAVHKTNNELQNSSDNIKRGFDDAAEAISSVEANASAANKITDKLDKLTSKTHLTADEQRQMKILVGELNELFPEMGLAIDDTGTSLNMTTAEIRAFTDEAYNMAKAAAYSDALKESLTAMAEAELAVAKAEIEHDDLLTQRDELEKQVASSIDKRKAAAEGMSDVDRELYSLGTEINEGYGTQKIALNDATEALEANEAAQEECKTTLEEAQKQYELNEAALQQLADQMGVSVEELTGMQGATDDLTGSEEELEAQTDETANAVAEAAEEIDEAAQKIQESYESMRDSAYTSAMEQSSLWKEMAAQEETSIEEMQKGLQSHITAYRNWNSNVSRVLSDARYGQDTAYTEMVNRIVQAGIDMAPQLAAIVQEMDSADGDISGIVNDFGEFSTLATQAADYTAKAGTALEYGTDEMRRVLEDSGVPDAAGGIIEDTAYELTNGAQTVEGAAETAAQAGVNAYASGWADSTGTVNQQVSFLRAAAGRGLDANNYSYYQSGYSAGYQYGSGMYASASYVAQAAAYVAQTAWSYLHHSTPEKGPLHGDDKWGKEMVENYAEAMISQIPTVERAAEKVADAASIQPNNPEVDLNATNGSYVFEAAIDYDTIYRAVRAGASDADNTVVINNREFARTLRDAGVSFA